MHKKIDLDAPKWPAGGPDIIICYVQYNDEYTQYRISAWGTAYRLLWAICLNFDKFILDNFTVIGHLTGFKEDPSW
jgi:hypothetical protein